MGRWWDPFDDEKGKGFNGGWQSYIPVVGWGAYGLRKGYEALSGLFSGTKDNFKPGTYTIPMAADADTQAAYQRQSDDYQRRVGEYFNTHDVTWEQAQQAIGPAPAAPGTDAASLSYQDRARLLSTAGGYGRLAGQLQDAAAGRGPSAAQDTLREGTARNIAGQYGMAASGNVAPGQRAALLGQAINNVGSAEQTGARDAAVLRASEVAGARQQLGSTLAGKAGIESTLYGGTQDVNAANQAAYQHADDTAAGIASSNADRSQKAKTATIGAVGGVAAAAAGAAVMSDIRAKSDIKPLTPSSDALYGGGGGKNTLYSATSPAVRRRAGMVLDLGPDGSVVLPSGPPRRHRRSVTMPGFPAYELPDYGEDPKYTVPKYGSGNGSPVDQEKAVADYSEKYDVKPTKLEYNAEMDEFRPVQSDRHVKEAVAVDAYNAGVEAGSGGRVRAPNLVFSSENGGNFRTPDEQLQYVDSVKRRPAPTPLFFDQDNGGTFREPLEQIRYTEALRTPAGSRQALAPIEPYEYRYKPEMARKFGEDAAPRAGIMAQEFAQSPNPAVRSAVIDTKDGLAIDGSRALSANLALSAGLDKRLRDIEGAMGKPTEYPQLDNEEPRRLRLAGAPR
jgi:hypothetical protein